MRSVKNDGHQSLHPSEVPPLEPQFEQDAVESVVRLRWVIPRQVLPYLQRQNRESGGLWASRSECAHTQFRYPRR